MRFFTICSNNYFAHAITLGRQLEIAHPGAGFTIFLVDKISGFEMDEVPFETVLMEDIGLPDLKYMIMNYNISELNTSIKPYCFLYLFDQDDGPVVYMDPDTYPVAPLVEVADAFQNGSDAVITPHILEPVESGGFRDDEFLRLGMYNLGFLGLSGRETTLDFLRWWGRRLDRECVIDVARGLFVDQKWADFIPAFIEETKVLRHPGYNVAYWNLHNRRLTRAADDAVLVNGQAARFMHFSGVSLDGSREQLSRHYPFFDLHNSYAYGDLLVEYQDKVRSAGYEVIRHLPFRYFFSPGGKSNLHALRDDTKAVAFVERGLSTYTLCRQILSLEHFEKIHAEEAPEYRRRRDFEASLMEEATGDIIYLDGYDYLAGSRAVFRSNYDYSYETTPAGDPIPNWREHVGSGAANFSNRVRAAIHIFVQEFEPRLDAPIYITEALTPLYQWMSQRFSNVIGSEYFGEEYEGGEEVRGARHENVEELSFDDESFDYVLSFDVFEHVAFYKEALREVLRCLRPGGVFYFTVPPNAMMGYETEVRAEITPDGDLVHHMEPEYHGNPVDDDGALCFRNYGWQLIDEMREIGFINPHILQYWDPAFGYLGENQLVFVAEKPSLIRLADLLNPDPDEPADPADKGAEK